MNRSGVETADRIDVHSGRVLLPDGVRRADLSIVDGRIAAIGDDAGEERAPDASHIDESGGGRAELGTQVIDASGMIVTAGLIDLQCNGAGGVDFTGEPTAMAAAAEVLPAFGVTSFLPTVVTAPTGARRAAIEAMGAYEHSVGARPLGLHFEGPALSAECLGAHDARYRRDPGELRSEMAEWITGHVALVTMAPELDDAGRMIAELTAGGVAVSAGHTAMSFDDLATAKRNGLRSVTHLFNAMTPFAHRAPGAVGAVLADADVVAGLICDGIHVDPVAVRAAWRALGPGRVVLVSDASAPLGRPYGRFQLGRRELIHDDTGVRTADGTLAGSALPLDRAVRNLRDFTGCDWTDAVRAATATPADLLGRRDIGRIATGARGDLVIFDDALHPRLVVVDGRIVFRDDRWTEARWRS
ncbi:MAG: N-acetylglucosamine-6-phosphate deacetylase [Actinomycetota bacterium]